MKKKIIGLGLMSLTILTLAVPVAARPYRPMLQGGPIVERVIARLDLTDAQREEVQSIVQEHRIEVFQALKSIKKERKLLFETIHTQPSSESDIRLQTEEVAEVMTELAILRSQIANEIYSVLTQEQMEEAEVMRQDLMSWIEGLTNTLRALVIDA